MHFFFSICCVVFNWSWQSVFYEKQEICVKHLFGNWWWCIRPKIFSDNENYILFEFFYWRPKPPLNIRFFWSLDRKLIMSTNCFNNFFFDTQWHLSQRISSIFKAIYSIFKQKKKESNLETQIIYTKVLSILAPFV